MASFTSQPACFCTPPVWPADPSLVTGDDPNPREAPPPVCGPPDLVISGIVPGPAGQDGKSAYELWLAAGYTGTVEQFLASLKGAPGRTGDKGKAGAPGLSASESGGTAPAGIPGGVYTRAYFTGAHFRPVDIGLACNTLIQLSKSRELVFGVSPVAAGKYLARATVQVGWVGEGDDEGGYVDLLVEGATKYRANWGLVQRGGPGIEYGTISDLSFTTEVDLTAGATISLKASGLRLAGGTLHLYSPALSRKGPGTFV